jgi:hypothetical protein
MSSRVNRGCDCAVRRDRDRDREIREIREESIEEIFTP